jgi:hypothetical protein
MWPSSLVDSVVSSHWNPATLCDRGSSRAGPADVTLSASGYLGLVAWKTLGMLSITVDRTSTRVGLSPPACALLAGDICMALTADPPPDFLRGRSVGICCGRTRQACVAEGRSNHSSANHSRLLVLTEESATHLIAAAASTGRKSESSQRRHGGHRHPAYYSQPSAARSRQSAWRCLSTRCVAREANARALRLAASAARSTARAVAPPCCK